MIYYLEDDVNIRDLTVYALTQAGYSARGFGDAQELFAALAEETPELVLLDIMLPGIDGLEVLRRLRDDPRSARPPIMMLTAKGTEFDKVVGLNDGADDYLAKPFGMMELIARVGALLRRAASPVDSAAELTSGPIVLSAASRTVKVGGESVDLTRKEFDLLQALLRHPGQVLTRDQLLADVWGIDFAGETRTVDVHIQTLRQKLATADKEASSFIETVYGVGYRLKSADNG